mgnify:CR=1 FL=1
MKTSNLKISDDKNNIVVCKMRFNFDDDDIVHPQNLELCVEELNKKNVPAKALWYQCLWASILCISGKYTDLLTYSTFASLLFYILTIYGIFILRKKEPNTERPYKAFGYPIVPILYLILTSLICVTLLIYDTKNTGLGLLIVLLGIPVYYLTKQKE